MRKPDEENIVPFVSAPTREVNTSWLLSHFDVIAQRIQKASIEELGQILAADPYFAQAVAHLQQSLFEGRKKEGVEFSRGAALVAALTPNFPQITQLEGEGMPQVVQAGVIIGMTRSEFYPANLLKQTYEAYVLKGHGDMSLDAELKSLSIPSQNPMALGIGFGLSLRFQSFGTENERAPQES